MILRSIRENLKNLTAKLDQKLFGEREFVIISNNCWGAEIYKRLNKEYNTPFVGLALFGPDYIKLLEKLDYYLSQKLEFTPNSIWMDGLVTYPIGKLDDIEIHFMHYKDSNEAESKWIRRLSRMNKVRDKSKYYFKYCDRDIATTTELIKKFHTLPLTNKISFGINQINSKEHIVIAEKENNTVPDGVVLYNISFKYIDIFKWIKTGEITNNWYGKIKALAKIA
jgi:uncharacterized protein (DUF1919 family)